MRLKHRWRQEECWLSYFLGFGLYYFIISFYLIRSTVSIKNGGYAFEKMRVYKGNLWTQKDAKIRMEDSNDDQKYLSKWRNRRNEINNKHIRWKRDSQNYNKIKRGNAVEGGRNYSFSNSRNITRRNQIKMMKFVNNTTDQSRNRKLLEDNNYAGNNNLTYSWAVKIPTNKNPISDEAYFHNVANRLAKHHGLINFGPIGGLSGFYYFVHKNFLNNMDAVVENGDEKGNITKHLQSHPEIEWVKHEPIQIRKKRTLEFKDQFFPSQWHLVSKTF